MITCWNFCSCRKFIFCSSIVLICWLAQLGTMSGVAQELDFCENFTHATCNASATIVWLRICARLGLACAFGHWVLLCPEERSKNVGVAYAQEHPTHSEAFCINGASLITCINFVISSVKWSSLL